MPSEITLALMAVFIVGFIIYMNSLPEAGGEDDKK